MIWDVLNLETGTLSVAILPRLQGENLRTGLKMVTRLLFHINSNGELKLDVLNVIVRFVKNTSNLGMVFPGIIQKIVQF